MEKLQSQEQFEELKQGERTVFLFSADWCPDCRVIDPLLPGIEVDYPEYEFVYVDRDQFIDICAEHDIFGIPSFLVYSEGVEKGRFVSKDRKTREEITAFLDNPEA
ncbi:MULTISPECIES: thioredoxin family protein [unclassified Sporosarcina]|uniref:thioredoxin family protein n=1 Tax=unclassified Sporosarcina TaxID=2647733 RepID=UPI00057A3F6D|nr:thioredoxin family protein [Sporosarcina sp. ZBG7A]VDG97150.1 Thioredoxin [Lysinibacillus sphaericus]